MNKKVVCVIPARGGSKVIPKKNLVDFCGKPLIAHTIEVALASQFIEKVYVSTDCQETASVSRAYGAICPQLRPSKFAEDWSTDKEVFVDFVKTLEMYESLPDYLVHLRCTTPNRDPLMIDDSIQRLISSSGYTSLRSFCVASKSPYKMWSDDGTGMLKPLLHLEIDGEDKEFFNQGRQSLPVVYEQDPYIDIYSVSYILSGRGLTGDRVLPFYLPKKSIDIDTLDDLKYARLNQTRDV